MIDFELTDGDKEVIALARRQAIGFQKRAKGIDRTMEFDRPDFAEQFAFEGQEDIVHVRDFAHQRADDLSGLTIIEPLIYLEESYGFKPLYWQGENADAMNVSLSGKLIEKVGTPEQIAAFQPLYLAWGMSEPNGGSDPASMRTVATYDAATDEWVINGEKIFSSNATHADGILVMCRAVGPRATKASASSSSPRGCRATASARRWTSWASGTGIRSRPSSWMCGCRRSTGCKAISRTRCRSSTAPAR
ncbi:acyl-CoA dehydrogenase family protein [Rhizorhabdus histidinilytica]